ncbi:MAG: GspH/FimT family pseudopilin [Bacillota bacterium]
MRQHREGFTLIEVMVVITVIGILAGMGSFGVRDFLGYYRLKSQAYTLASNLQKAKQLAINQRQDYGIKVKDDGYQLINFDTGEVIYSTELNQGIIFDRNDDFTGDEIKFVPTGNTDWSFSGTIILKNGQQQKYEVVVSVLGRIRVDKRN